MAQVLHQGKSAIQRPVKGQAEFRHTAARMFPSKLLGIHPGRRFRLGFDLILIDCPPNLYQCRWNALLASNFVVIPVPPEGIGIASATFEIVGLPPYGTPARIVRDPKRVGT